MRVKSIGVKDLFGVFNHEIPLRSEERVTLVHGPNGFGKTVMLKMIAGLLTGNTAIFEHTPFGEFYVTLEDGTTAAVRRKIDQKEKQKPQIKLEYFTRDTGGKTTFVPPAAQKPEVPRAVLQQVDRAIPSPYRVSGAGWVDDEGHPYTLAEMLDKFPRAAAQLPPEHRPGTVFEMLRGLQVFFVETNRLGAETPTPRQSGYSQHTYYVERQGFLEDPQPTPPRVKQYSEDIVKRFQAVLADYAKHSQESDRTFPERLVRFVRDGQKAYAERDILNQMADLENKRRRLINLGLLDSESGLRDLTEDDVRRFPEALTIYVDDVQQKLRVFDDMAHRIGSLWTLSMSASSTNDFGSIGPEDFG